MHCFNLKCIYDLAYNGKVLTFDLMVTRLEQREDHILQNGDP